MEQQDDLGVRANGSPASTPNSPADAFKQFVQMIKQAPATLESVDPEDLFRLLLPFIVNPYRNEAAVREIVNARCAAVMGAQIRPLLNLVRRIPFTGVRLKDTLEHLNPTFFRRLQELEEMLKRELLPGSVKVHPKPIQYIDSPPGYELKFHRYRFTLETLIRPSEGDTLDKVSIRLTATSDDAQIEVIGISPQTCFSEIGIKTSAADQMAVEETVTDKESVGGELSVTGAKLSSSSEYTKAVKHGAQKSTGSEQSHKRFMHYVVARKIGNLATWDVMAGIGQIDAGGTEYSVDLLIPATVERFSVAVDANVRWTSGGTFLTDLAPFPLELPRPLAKRGSRQ
jgi:hypothetical protein